MEMHFLLKKISTKELKTILPESTTLKELLKAVRAYTKRQDEDLYPSGLVILEVKTPSPFCAPFDETGFLLMETVVAVVHRANMVNQVKIESLSTSLIQIAASLAPEIGRILAVNAL